MGKDTAATSERMETVNAPHTHTPYTHPTHTPYTHTHTHTHTHTQFKLLPDLKRINKILFFKLEYNRYPMLCYSVLYKRVSQLYTYIHIDSVPEGTKQFVGLTLS